MDLWYDYLTSTSWAERLQIVEEGHRTRGCPRFESRARSKTSLQALKKLTTRESGHLRIRNQPPLLVPMASCRSHYDQDESREAINQAYPEYVETTADHMQAAAVPLQGRRPRAEGRRRR